jgi:hypothetical protein
MTEMKLHPDIHFLHRIYQQAKIRLLKNIPSHFRTNHLFLVAGVSGSILCRQQTPWSTGEAEWRCSETGQYK